MSISTDKGHFFQTSASLEADERRAIKRGNIHGNPIVLPSKILAVIPDPFHKNCIYVAESGNLARRVDLSINDKGKHTFKGHTAPVTCLTLSSSGTALFTGSWDKHILSFNTSTRQLLHSFSAHTDFLKCLLYIPVSASLLPSGGVLLSGSADTSITLWNPATGGRYQTLTGHHARGVQDLALDPVQDEEGVYTIYSAGSEKDIRRWDLTIPPTSSTHRPHATENTTHPPLRESETSVYAIHFTPPPNSTMWTASADGTARCIDIRSPLPPNDPDATPPTTECFTHPDFVTDVLVVDDTWVVTSCRDEHVRVWSLSTGKLYHTFEGHFEEVTGLCLVGEGAGQLVVSVSIDCTVRKWSLERGSLEKAVEEAKKSNEVKFEEEKERQERERMKGKGGSVLTEEEERELAELMEMEEE